jgi:D-alanyl-D-alanine dipeptidase
LRYLTTENFVGEVLRGYYVNRAILTKQAASAIKQANEMFKNDGYQIVIYDSYRPQKTVDQFIEWAFDGKPDLQKAKYSPLIDKSDMFDMGYLAKKSGHTRGSTLDMSIIKIGTPLKEV